MQAMRPLGPAASTHSLATWPAVSSVYQNCMRNNSVVTEQIACTFSPSSSWCRHTHNVASVTQ